MRVEGASKDTTSLGTWGFASPEQYGFAQTDARSDVYSIGRVLGFALTGVRPDDEAYEQILKKNIDNAPATLVHAITRACSFEPSARFQSAAEMAGVLSGSSQPKDDGTSSGANQQADRSKRRQGRTIRSIIRRNRGSGPRQSSSKTDTHRRSARRFASWRRDCHFVLSRRSGKRRRPRVFVAGRPVRRRFHPRKVNFNKRCQPLVRRALDRGVRLVGRRARICPLWHRP